MTATTNSPHTASMSSDRDALGTTNQTFERNAPAESLSSAPMPQSPLQTMPSQVEVNVPNMTASSKLQDVDCHTYDTTTGTGTMSTITMMEFPREVQHVVDPKTAAPNLNVDVFEDEPVIKRRKNENRVSWDRERIAWITLPFMLIIIMATNIAFILRPQNSAANTSDNNNNNEELLMDIVSGLRYPENATEQPRRIFNHTYQQIKFHPDSPQARAFYDFLLQDAMTNNILEKHQQDPLISHWHLGLDGNQIEQRYALATLYYATNGSHWTNATGWLNGTLSECSWSTTTTTTSDNCRVRSGDSPPVYQSLSLSNNNLQGQLPPEILDRMMGFIRSVDLSSNSLTSLPVGERPLRNLKHLDLHNNSLTGDMFSDGKRVDFLKGVKSLWLQKNALSGSIDGISKMMDRLTSLGASFNHLTGTLPTTWESPFLTELYLDNNMFTGGIPAAIAIQSDLKHLWLQNNPLSSHIPPELGELSQLETLILENTGLSGAIPTEITRMTSLQELDLRGNPDLSGIIPGAFCPITKIDCTDKICGCECAQCPTPTKSPTGSPTELPTTQPTTSPSLVPSLPPSLSPSISPSLSPSTLPTRAPEQVTCCYVMAGQSNMLGNADLGHFEALIQELPGQYLRYYNNQQWQTANHVFVSFDDEYGDFQQTREGPLLGSGYGTNDRHFGPEVGFGFTMADLALSTGGGGGDSSSAMGSNVFSNNNNDNDMMCTNFVLVKTVGVDALFRRWNAPNGEFFQLMIDDVPDALARAEELTGSSNRAVLAGVLWFHGYSDVYEPEWLSVYEQNLETWIYEMRRAWSNLPSLASPLPVVIGQMGGKGLVHTTSQELEMRAIQAAVANNVENVGLTNTSQFVTGFDTTDQSQIFDGDFHYWGRADIILSVGEQMAKDMWALIQSLG